MQSVETLTVESAVNKRDTGDYLTSLSTQLYSNLYFNDKMASAKYFIDFTINFMKEHPENSEFVQKNEGIISLVKNRLIPDYTKMLMIYSGFGLLYFDGYDALILRENDKGIGHNAFQIHNDNTLHIFSMGVLESYKGKGLATKMQLDTINIARERGINSIRIGGGGSEEVKGLCEKLSSMSQELKITPRPDYWFDILV